MFHFKLYQKAAKGYYFCIGTCSPGIAQSHDLFWQSFTY